MRKIYIAVSAIMLSGLAAGAPWAQQPPPKAVQVTGRQFLLNQNQQLTTAIADLLDENGKYREENEALKKRAESAEAELAKLKGGDKKE